jgi:lactate dehydrogenase-like 2-hydroxyacid dehydrogenase
MGLLIDVARGVTAADRHVRRGDWVAKGPPAPATRVSGKRLGLLGMGRIGQAIAPRAAGFSMDIRYHSRTPKPALPWRHEASLLQLAEWADFLVVVCAGGVETRHLVSADVLRALGPEGFLVNVARGSIVDQDALVAALQAGRLGGAALDVFEDEPQVPTELMALDNVVLLPHVGSATRETRRAMAELVLGNVRSFLESGRLLTPCVAPVSG